MRTLDEHSVLLYDGVCGLCDGAVQFILRHDRRHTLRFATLDGDFARSVMQRHPQLRNLDSLVFVQRNLELRTEIVSVRSDAALLLAQYLGGATGVLGTLLRIVPKFIRDYGYDIVAGFRYRVFGKLDSCRLPTADERSRFID